MLCYQTYKTKTNLLRASELVFLQWCISEFSSLSKKKKEKPTKKSQLSHRSFYFSGVNLQQKLELNWKVRDD